MGGQRGEDTSHKTRATSPEIGTLRMGHGSWPHLRTRGTIPEKGVCELKDEKARFLAVTAAVQEAGSLEKGRDTLSALPTQRSFIQGEDSLPRY